MTRQEIEELFDFRKEKKSTDEERLEKRKRRIDSIIIKVDDIRECFYSGTTDFFRIVTEINIKYSQVITNEDIELIKSELLEIINLISNEDYESILNFDFKDYSRILKKLNISYVKSLNRLKNMKQLTKLFLSKKISESLFEDDLYDQHSFFLELYNNLESITPTCAWIKIVRYDLKTIKKKEKV
jgi:hypothetical protein